MCYFGFALTSEYPPPPLNNVWPPDFWPEFCPDFWPGFLGSENTVYSSIGTEKYSVQVYRDEENSENHKFQISFFLLVFFRNFINMGGLLTGATVELKITSLFFRGHF